ncbi:uncharacterized protein BHQ10_007388 [Talaromyces amestolkiae]|uniref:Zn(2)-C6 fungal-type domain-containing protein n=1 Tax=Talaromyces amestolkiae TaxID=1196081 RepID=A0A364L6F4_TALAM|nr:uncharacterized protein BHQ10_007388 [Talaromyces amestolkiae]RAO71376.1 hypothetical protein BHQ10_007388 [Talaromyces amestolkiae]
MAYHDVNRYGLGRGGRPSSHRYASPPMSSSRQATSGSSYLHNSPSGYRRTNSNMNAIQSPENGIYEEYGTTPMAISPYPEADVMNMHPAPYTEHPRMNNILGNPPQVHVSSHAFPHNMGYSPPWNVLHTEVDYRAIAAETSDELFHSMIDQNMLLNVPHNPRSHGTGETRGSFSTVGTPHTASSDCRSEVSLEHTEIRRGGRQQGSRLPEDGVLNVRQVRDVGACIRCFVLRERCSPGTPCLKCSITKGRKWVGCIRSFEELTKLLNPDTLAGRLRPQALTQWMSTNIRSTLWQRQFDLPLSFGFGENFIGFRGVEYIPNTDEARWRGTVGHSDIHPESPQFHQSLYVYPVNSSSLDVQRMVWEWLKQTLGDRHSMEDWLRTCFRGDELKWIRDLLRVTRRYTFESWNERPQEEVDSQLDDNLLDAWMACLIVTILSLPINIPTDVVDSIVPNLQFGSYQSPYPNASRALSKCVKSLLFDMYQQFVKRITLALENFDKLKIEQISERRLAHVNCISVLLMVLTSRIQTSLMDDSRLTFERENDPTIWDQTLVQLENVEGVFKNIILFVRYMSKEWFKQNRGSRLRDLPREIREIGQNYHNAIEPHINVKLEAFRGPDVLFHKPNMQRVFAFFFNLECQFRKTR